ncbi:MAG: YebC/PmpR family DNA-binding transcriptional regulator [Clostridiales bacterium]|nr:YebC/PmpR family DNA-binding transcriptional regulator [Candidatus Crickella merdequi]
MGRHGTIANRKSAQDSRRAAMFTKYARQIIVAAKDGGDPDFNPSLRVAIDKAKGIGMPNDNINRAIKKGTGELAGESYEELQFEGYGPSGVAIIVDALTDNKNRTAAFVRSTFDKNGGNLGTPGCVSYMFSRKGVILIEKEDDMDEDEIMMMALEAGAEDMIAHEDHFEIQTEPTELTAVHEAVKEAGFEIAESGVEYIPSMEANVAEDAVKALNKLINTLEDNDDVQNVYYNCELDEE